MERILKVSQEHVWIGIEDQHVFFGLTNYGQGELGQVISVDLPEVGDKVERGEAFALSILLFFLALVLARFSASGQAAR